LGPLSPSEVLVKTLDRSLRAPKFSQWTVQAEPVRLGAAGPGGRSGLAAAGQPSCISKSAFNYLMIV